MPTYEYKCPDCGEAFERFQSIMAAPIKQCPKCGKKHVKRLIGKGAGIIFKGGGFYETDYRSEAYSAAAKADSAKPAETSNASSDSATKTDAKPAADAKPSTEAKPAGDAKPVEKKSAEAPAPPAPPKSQASSSSAKKSSKKRN